VSDRIQLLSDAVANQIAAGEVVQRPASAVKELLENSIDAGATDIRLIIEDGGSKLIQVVDNGCGMSPTDARMCFERHATSKITSAEDLFRIRSFGFRGEAMASIAAVAQVEMKTRREQDEAATLIRIEGSEVVEQGFAAAPVGTGISVRNLFYNIPARRNFLKSPAVETRHIVEEFCRLALAWPDRRLTMYQNGSEVYRLEPGSQAKRVADVLDRRKESDFLPVEEATDWLQVSGYTGKPGTERKTRGEQYFYVNRRFIKNSYLNHAVQGAYEGLIPADTYPSFVLFLEIDPSHVDVNVHPTKTEVKFDDERALYSIVRAAVKHALGLYNLVPLNNPAGIEQQHHAAGQTYPIPSHPESGKQKSFYNPFGNDTAWNNTGLAQKGWNKAFEIPEEEPRTELRPGLSFPKPEVGSSSVRIQKEDCFALPQGLTAFRMNGQLCVADNQRAHERVLFEYYLQAGKNTIMPAQQLLFPRTLELRQADMNELLELLPELQRMGIDIAPFGQNTVIINGLPADQFTGNESDLIDEILEQYRLSRDEPNTGLREKAALALARQQASRNSKPLEPEEMVDLLNRLFRCSQPALTPGGKPTFTGITSENLLQLLKRNN
jgi:DNA mismatch repair protein MutL